MCTRNQPANDPASKLICSCLIALRWRLVSWFAGSLVSLALRSRHSFSWGRWQKCSSAGLGRSSSGSQLDGRDRFFRLCGPNSDTQKQASGVRLDQRCYRPLINAIASARLAGSSRNVPRTALVIVTAPGLRTPRMVMHVCSASKTTITPLASSSFSIKSATV